MTPHKNKAINTNAELILLTPPGKEHIPEYQLDPVVLEGEALRALANDPIFIEARTIKNDNETLILSNTNLKDGNSLIRDLYREVFAINQRSLTELYDQHYPGQAIDDIAPELANANILNVLATQLPASLSSAMHLIQHYSQNTYSSMINRITKYFIDNFDVMLKKLISWRVNNIFKADDDKIYYESNIELFGFTDPFTEINYLPLSCNIKSVYVITEAGYELIRVTLAGPDQKACYKALTNAPFIPSDYPTPSSEHAKTIARRMIMLLQHLAPMTVTSSHCLQEYKELAKMYLSMFFRDTDDNYNYYQEKLLFVLQHLKSQPDLDLAFPWAKDTHAFPSHPILQSMLARDIRYVQLYRLTLLAESGDLLAQHFVGTCQAWLDKAPSETVHYESAVLDLLHLSLQYEKLYTRYYHSEPELHAINALFDILFSDEDFQPHTIRQWLHNIRKIANDKTCNAIAALGALKDKSVSTRAQSKAGNMFSKKTSASAKTSTATVFTSQVSPTIAREPLITESQDSYHALTRFFLAHPKNNAEMQAYPWFTRLFKPSDAEPGPAFTVETLISKHPLYLLLFQLAVRAQQGYLFESALHYKCERIWAQDLPITEKETWLLKLLSLYKAFAGTADTADEFSAQQLKELFIELLADGQFDHPITQLDKWIDAFNRPTSTSPLAKMTAIITELSPSWKPHAQLAPEKISAASTDGDEASLDDHEHKKLVQRKKFCETYQALSEQVKTFRWAKRILPQAATDLVLTLSQANILSHQLYYLSAFALQGDYFAMRLLDRCDQYFAAHDWKKHEAGIHSILRLSIRVEIIANNLTDTERYQFKSIVNYLLANEINVDNAAKWSEQIKRLRDIPATEQLAKFIDIVHSMVDKRSKLSYYLAEYLPPSVTEPASLPTENSMRVSETDTLIIEFTNAIKLRLEKSPLDLLSRYTAFINSLSTHFIESAHTQRLLIYAMSLLLEGLMLSKIRLQPIIDTQATVLGLLNPANQAALAEFYHVYNEFILTHTDDLTMNSAQTLRPRLSTVDERSVESGPESGRRS